MIEFAIFIFIAFLCICSWINYSKNPSAGKLVLAIILSIFCAPTLAGAIFNIALIFLILIAILSIASIIVQWKVIDKEDQNDKPKE